MSASRALYLDVSSAIKSELDACLANDEVHGANGITSVAKRIAQSFAFDNPRFDNARFLKACGISSAREGSYVLQDNAVCFAFSDGSEECIPVDTIY